jgi:hypothetical protein
VAFAFKENDVTGCIATIERRWRRSIQLEKFYAANETASFRDDKYSLARSAYPKVEVCYLLHGEITNFCVDLHYSFAFSHPITDTTVQVPSNTKKGQYEMR